MSVGNPTTLDEQRMEDMSDLEVFVRTLETFEFDSRRNFCN
jgi:hypothetical protein